MSVRVCETPWWTLQWPTVAHQSVALVAFVWLQALVQVPVAALGAALWWLVVEQHGVLAVKQTTQSMMRRS